MHCIMLPCRNFEVATFIIAYALLGVKRYFNLLILPSPAAESQTLLHYSMNPARNAIRICPYIQVILLWYNEFMKSNNVIKFKHPTRAVCEITGLFYDTSDDKLPLYYICNTTGAYACANSMKDAKIRLAECRLMGINSLTIIKVA
jgi:hypothetical protein